MVREAMRVTPCSMGCGNARSRYAADTALLPLYANVHNLFNSRCVVLLPVCPSQPKMVFFHATRSKPSKAAPAWSLSVG